MLTVWRRIPGRRSDINDPGGGTNESAKQRKKSAGEKQLLTQKKELWIFWYGDKPEEQLKKLVHSQLREADISGTWENQLPYEARTLLYKALNNLIERYRTLLHCFYSQIIFAPIDITIILLK